MNNIGLYICASACLSINPFVDIFNVSMFDLFLIVMLWTLICCRKEDLFQGPKPGSCLTLGNEFSKETQVLTKQEILLGKGNRNPREHLCHMARSLWFYGDGISFWVVFSQLFWLRVLPGGACFFQSRWMPARRILGVGRTCGVSFWPFLNSSG